MQLSDVEKRIIDSYAELAEVKAIAIGGSSATGSDDATSDIDLYNFVDSEPSVEQREKVALPYSSRHEIGGDYFGPGDEFRVDQTGRELDVMFFDRDWFEGLVRSVWLDCRPSNSYTTAFLYTLSNLVILHDPENWLSGLKSLIDTPYPERLRDNIIRRGLMLMKDKPFSSYIEQIDKAIRRKDSNSVNHRTAAFMESYFDALFAANRLLHPGEKRLVAFALSNCPVLPEDFEKDMAAAFSCRGPELPEILSAMVEKLRAIVL